MSDRELAGYVAPILRNTAESVFRRRVQTYSRETGEVNGEATMREVLGALAQATMLGLEVVDGVPSDGCESCGMATKVKRKKSCEASLEARVDAFAVWLRAGTPGPRWKRADVVRLLLEWAISAAAKSALPAATSHPRGRRTGTLETRTYAGGRVAYFGRLRLADGTRSGRMPAPDGMTKADASRWLAGQQAREDAEQTLYRAKAKRPK